MQDYQLFLSQYRARCFKKGEIILYQGDVPPFAFVVKEGIVKTYNLTRQGEEKPISYDLKYDAFPITWVFNKVQKAQYYYEAFNDCEVFCVPPTEYMRHMKTHRNTLFFVMDRLVERAMGFQLRINALEQSKASCKIVNILHYLALRFGEELTKHTVRIKISLTQQDIANLTGLTRETTGLELKKLGEQDVVTCQNRQYIVRTNKLDELLDEEYAIGLNGKQPRLKA